MKTTQLNILNSINLIPLGLVSLSLLSGVILSSSIVSAEDTSVIDQIRLTVPIACTMTGENTSHTATLDPGTYSGASGSEYENGIGKTTLTAICNDDNGFSIYAIGFTENKYEGENHTKLIGSGTGSTIATKAYASGDTTSNWSMKLTKITDSTESYNPQNLTIQSDTEGTFSNWHSIPDTYTKVTQYHANTGSSTTDTTLGVKLETTYAAYISSSQPADTYIGQVKYTLVHPYDHAEPDEFTSETLQSVADWGGKVAPGQTVTVTDARDGQEYTVARLADGKLWMTKNLRLDIGRANITAENTNNPTQAFLTAASSATSSNEWCTDNNSTCTDQIKYNTSNINNPTTDSEGHKYDEYGVYYNWYTATAGNGTYDTASNTNVSGDICPSGWHLPTGTVTSRGAPNIWTGDYWKLAAAQDGSIALDNSNYDTITGITGSERLRSSPNNYLYSGYYYGGSVQSQGELGHYWSSTKINNNYSYTFYINSSNTAPGYASLAPSSGAPVRCVTEQESYGFDATLTNAGKTKHNGYYKMQDADSSICSAVAEGQLVDLIDERDDEIYKVAKLADGNCWMLENLRLDPTDSTTAANMNESNTNATTEAITNYQNGGSANTGWSNVSVENVDIGFNSASTGYSVPRINNRSKNVLVAGHGQAMISGQAKTGVYYNYCAVSMGTYCYPPGGGLDIPDTLIDVTMDACPANWRLPTGYGGEYYRLKQIYYSTDPANTNSLDYNLSIVSSGIYNANDAARQNTNGYYWSSTSSGSNTSILMTYYNYQNDLSSYDRQYGFTVRCLISK